MANIIDNLITRVSMQGVDRVKTDQTLIGAGFKALSGDIRGAAADWKNLGTATKMAIGGGMMAGGVAFGGLMVRSVIQMDSLERALTAVSGSSAETEKQLIRLKEVAKAPGLGFVEAVQGSVRLQAAGLEAKLAENALTGFGNAIASVGGGKAELDGVTLALSQIASKGKVSAEEINQIAERVPQIRQVMLRAFGTADTMQLQKMGIGSEQFISAIVAELNKLPKATGGVQNSIDNLADTWNQFLYGSGKGSKGGIKGAVDLLNTVLGGFNKLNDATRGIFGGAVLVGTGMTIVAGAIIMVAPGIKALADMWRQVAINATAATGAQRTAAAAGAGAGASAAAGGAAATGAGAAAGGAAKKGLLGGLLARLLPGGLLPSGSGAAAGAAGVTAGGMAAAALPATIVTEALDWLLGTVTGQKGKRLGNGGWLPNLSPTRMLGEGWKASMELGEAQRRRFFGRRSVDKRAQDYISGGTHSVRREFEERVARQGGIGGTGSDAGWSPGAGIDRAGETNKLLKELVDETKKQTNVIGGGKRLARALNQGDLQRAVYATMADQVI